MPTVLMMRKQGLTFEEKAEFEESFNGQAFEIRKGDVSSRRSSKGWLAECQRAGLPEEVRVATTLRRLSSKLTDEAATEGYKHSASLPK